MKTRRPIMILLEALGKRWALRILWELRGPPMTFRALRRAADDLSPSVLNARLAELRELGIVQHGDEGYALTRAGEKLATTLLEMDAWARRHTKVLT